ncbi:hypothetical protein LOK49_LG12G02484 [Camellia lanceoleosa]|uniref:Uncharacterized protein n=1 Tax=Camellia lanceoleosa TaxID=1840588 RepID=A0ACC0FUF8_9ERIC|nr:hypothetical protein LOK49_LG12G02484 [Camellia lanceoleosa]
MASSSTSPVSEELELFDSPTAVEDVPSLCLLGKVLAPKSLNNNTVSSIIKGAWRVRGELSISPWSVNTFLFQFSEAEDRNRILSERPWSIMGSLLVLQTLSPNQTFEEVDFNWCPFWVQAHGLPIQNMTKQNGLILGNRLGKVLSVEAPQDGLLLHRSFLRIRVEINIQHPLPRGLWLKRSPGNNGVWINFKYEKLTDFCYDCGRIGHDNKSCKFVSKEAGSSSGYGPDLRTGVPRSIVSPVHFAKPAGVSSDNSPRPTHGTSPSASMVAHGLGVPRHRTTAASPQYSPPPLPESCAHTPAPPQLATSGMSNSQPRGPQSETAFAPTPTRIEPSPTQSLLKPISTPNPSFPPFGPTTRAGLLPDANTKPNYFVTEPPDSPSTPNSPKELEPTDPATDLGPTHAITILQYPGPIPPPLGISSALDLCLSKAINTLSLKRKAPADDLPLNQPLKLLKTTEPAPPRHLPILHSSTASQRGHPRRPRSTPGRKLVKRRVRNSLATPALDYGASELVDINVQTAEGREEGHSLVPIEEHEHEALIGSVNPPIHATAVPNSPSHSGWQPPSHTSVKFNCDAAFSHSTSSAALAVILRDSQGNLLTGCAQSCKASSAAQAEAHSVRLACLMAKALNLSRVEIESDNKTVISLCVSETVPPWEFSAIIMDIRGLAPSYSLSFSWTSRHNNAKKNW